MRMHVVLCNFITCVHPSPQTRYRGVCKDPCVAFFATPTPLLPLHTPPSLTPGFTHLFSISIILLFQECYTHGMMQFRNLLQCFFVFFFHSASFPNDSYKPMQVSRVCFALFLIKFCGMDDAS